MTQRTLIQRAIRALLGTVVIVAGVMVPTGIPLIPALLGAQLAYDGSDRRVLAWTTGFLVMLELFFALDLGVLSLAYLATAAALSVLGRLVSLTPWTASDGWDVQDYLRTVVVACIGAAMVTTASTLVETLYGYGILVPRLATHLTAHAVGWLVPLCGLALLVMRRLDMPFKRRIRFGT